MGGVYCPTCEAGVEVTAKFCLSCGHDLTVQGPITATGHDVNQLKDVIRQRDDMSMAEKFDMIAQIEDGANPISLGIAAPAEGDMADVNPPQAQTTNIATHLSSVTWGGEAPQFLTEQAVEGTSTGKKLKAGKFSTETALFNQAMDLGRKAAINIMELGQEVGPLVGHPSVSNVPIMKPPAKSFCPKCGSNILANATLQWKKWGAATEEALAIQLESSMTAAMMHVAGTYLETIQDLEDQLVDARLKAEKATQRAETKKDVDQETKASTTSDQVTEEQSTTKEKAADVKKPTKAKAKSSTGKKEEKAKPKSTSTSKPKPKSGGLFGAKKPKKTYEGKPGGKADWFLNEALDTVYDPHGTGKSVKGATILARSAEGNVRVRDVIRAYAEDGEDGISDLAKTSPLTKYLIEAYDAC